MPLLKVQEPAPLALMGDYEMDLTKFTNREANVIKTEAGVRLGEVPEALAAGDNDLLVAITLILLQRADKGTVAENRDTIWDLPIGAVTVDYTDAEKAAEEEASKLPPVPEPSSSGSSNGESGPSGSDSEAVGGRLASVPSPTGSPRSATGVTSDPVTSAS
jgi:hypothetical protein